MKPFKGVPKQCHDCRETALDKINCSTIMHNMSQALCIFQETRKDHPRFKANYAPKKAHWLIRWGNKLLNLYSKHPYCCDDTGGYGLTF